VVNPLVLKGTSDCKEALPLRDVWRSATTMSGGQCAMTDGMMWMPELPADNWDSLTLVGYGMAK